MSVHRSVLLSTLFAIWLLPGLAAAQGFLVPPQDHVAPSGGTFGLESQRVLIAVEAGVASYQVEQTFRNNTASQLEATFYFPLPEGASLAEFSMWVNGVKTKGELLERQQAVAIYEDIVRRMKDPGVLEYAGQDLIKARIFPIQPHGTQQIQVIFESLVEVDGSLALVDYPLRAPAALSGTTGDLTVKVELHSDIPVKSVYSPSHAVDVAHQGDGVVVAGFEQVGARFDRDFKLYYTLSEEPVGVSVVSYKVPGEDGYFLLMAAPGEDPTASAMPKDITFVVDTSGSMAGDKIRGARDGLRFCLQSLGDNDRFNVVRFSTGVEPFSIGLVDATPDNVGRALGFVERFEALGGTNISEALDTALQHQPSPGRPYYVVFLTDGLPTVGVTSADAILRQVGGPIAAADGAVRFFSFGVGYDVNTQLLDALAFDNRGTAEYLEPGEDIEVEISGFYRKISRPVLADVALDLAGAGAYDVYPRELPDLFSGSQLIVMGRYKNSASTRVKMSGVSAGDPQAFTTSVQFASNAVDHEFIPRMWAQRRVGFLLDEIRRSGEQPELVDAVVQLSKRFGIMTPYTSFLVVEDIPVAERPQPVFDGPRITMPGTAATGVSRTTFEFDDATVDGEVLQWSEEEERRMREESADPAPLAAPSASRGSRGGGWGRAKKAAKDAEKLDMSGFSADSGEGAVAASEAIGALRDADQDESDALTQVVRDKVFFYADGAWVDESFELGMDVLEIRTLSDAYFALLRARPALRSYAALGEDVVIVVGSGKAVHISPAGGEPTEKEIERFLR